MPRKKSSNSCSRNVAVWNKLQFSDNRLSNFCESIQFCSPAPPFSTALLANNDAKHEPEYSPRFRSSFPTI